MLLKLERYSYLKVLKFTLGEFFFQKKKIVMISILYLNDALLLSNE